MAEKMRYENEIENAKVDDEFNNSEEDLSAEDIYRVIYGGDSRRSRHAARRRTRSFSARSGTETRRRESASSRAT